MTEGFFGLLECRRRRGELINIQKAAAKREEQVVYMVPLGKKVVSAGLNCGK